MNRIGTAGELAFSCNDGAENLNDCCRFVPSGTKVDNLASNFGSLIKLNSNIAIGSNASTGDKLLICWMVPMEALLFLCALETINP